MALDHDRVEVSSNLHMQTVHSQSTSPTTHRVWGMVGRCGPWWSGLWAGFERGTAAAARSVPCGQPPPGTLLWRCTARGESAALRKKLHLMRSRGLRIFPCRSAQACVCLRVCVGEPLFSHLALVRPGGGHCTAWMVEQPQ